MKKYAMLMVVYVLPFYVSSQNLVPNPSFEDTLNCPQAVNELYKAIGWKSFSHSPDYYNSCSIGPVDVPINQAGIRTPKSGNAYAGIFVYWTAATIREYAAIKLINPLTIGQIYYVSFFVSPAINHNIVGIAVNHLGCKFSVDSFSVPNPMPINNYAQVVENNIINDTLNWTKISGSFIADSTYNYISIGSFFSDSLNSTSFIDTSAYFAYYFIDDVCVSTDSNTIVSLTSTSLNEIHPVTIYPNPASGILYLDGENLKSYEIYDFTGRKLIFETIHQDNKIITIDVSSIPSGIYLCKIITNKKIIVYKIVKK